MQKQDGSGYPHGLAGEQIPLPSEIICVVDVYDALTTTRSYRAAMDPGTALAKMTELRHWWREEVFDAFRAVTTA